MIVGMDLSSPTTLWRVWSRTGEQARAVVERGPAGIGADDRTEIGPCHLEHAAEIAYPIRLVVLLFLDDPNRPVAMARIDIADRGDAYIGVLQKLPQASRALIANANHSDV